MKKKVVRVVMAVMITAALMVNLTACTKKTEGENDKQQSTCTESENNKQSTYMEESGAVSSEAEKSEGEKNPWGLTLENLPILDGATANEPYYEGVVAEMLGISNEEAKKNVLCSTTNEAFNNLIYKRADMIFVSYPSAAQLEEAKNANVEFEYHQILTGAFVFFVNADNPVDSLSIEQLRGIYRGEITNWKEVGGNDEPIVAFQREEGSGSQNGMYRYLLNKEELMKAPEKHYFSDMEGILYAFGNADYDNGTNAIGYSYYYYVANMKCNDKIKLIALEGVEPNNETIGDGTYPFCNPTLAVVRKGTPSDSPVYTILDWIMSDEGAALAERLGYVANRTGGNLLQ